jgi:WXG100 family type VII secretion target
MAIDGISISLEEVTQVASSMRTTNSALYARLSDIRISMNNLVQNWQSPAEEAIIKKFNKLASTFENYKNIVESYAKFLDNTVTNYQSTESANTNNANSFR